MASRAMALTKVLRKMDATVVHQATVRPRERRLNCQISQGYAVRKGVLGELLERDVKGRQGYSQCDVVAGEEDEQEGDDGQADG